MMKRVLIAAIVPMALTACQLMTNDQLREQSKENQVRDQATVVQKTRADNEVKYTDLQNDVRVMAGRIETVEHNQQLNRDSTRQEIDLLKKQIQAQTDKVTLLTQQLESEEQRLNAALQVAANAPLAPAPPGSGGPRSGEEGAGSAGGAAVGAGGSANNTSGAKLFADAENSFAKKEFKKAIVKYQSYRDKSPRGSKVAEATYKIGVCFTELGLKKDAKEFFQETIETFPGSPASKKAKFRLSQLR